MSAPGTTDDRDDASARERAWEQWTETTPAPKSRLRRLFRRESWRDEIQPGEEGDLDAYVAPLKRSIFPPHFLLICAAGLAFLALEPTSDLSYELFGSATVVNLGEPGDYHLDRARSGAPATLNGISYPDRGNFSRNLTDYEVLALTTVPVLVRRTPQPHPAPNTAQLYEGRGRIIRIAGDDSTFWERLVDPAARYTTLRQQFQAIGELPLGKPCWLLLEGDLPRQHLSTILLPFVLWAAAIVFAFGAWRSSRLRRSR